MYKNPDMMKGGYNPLNNDADDILGLYDDNDIDTQTLLGEGSVHDDTFSPSLLDEDRIKSERSEVRESVAWFKRPMNAAAIPESMNFDEVESIMWRKVTSANSHQCVSQPTKKCVLFYN